jgi:plastocyanin
MRSQHKRLCWIMGLGMATGFCSALSGCGGGAARQTTVAYRPSRPESAEKEVTHEAPGEKTESGSAAKPGGVGTLKGRIIYGGTFSPLPPLYAKGNASKDNEVCGHEAAPNQTVVVNDGGLANVFIWLDKVPKGAKIPDSSNGEVVFDQKYCVFKPHAMIMRTGQTVRVLNSDPILHNTHTKPERNNEFNQGIQGNTETPLVYSRPEKKPLSVVCDIHPWMIAYHLPLDHPFAAVSGDDGSFEIPNLPSGKLEFKLWHEVGKEIEKAYKVDIKPDETTTVEITVPASKLTP